MQPSEMVTFYWSALMAGVIDINEFKVSIDHLILDLKVPEDWILELGWKMFLMYQGLK